MSAKVQLAHKLAYLYIQVNTIELDFSKHCMHMMH